jgi:hypothetical protein
MMRPSSHLPHHPAFGPGSSGLAESLALLLEAHDNARSADRPVWDFAVELSFLLATSLSPSTLRWLVCRGYLAQGVEVTKPKAAHRAFRRIENLSLDDHSCFVLTEAGVEYAREGCGGPPRNGAAASPGPGAAEPGSEMPKPTWDAERRELRVGGELVKRFTQPAENQETILSAFEEEGWPWHIDDPLPQVLGQDPKERLHKTVNNLNRGQHGPRVHFGRCQNGQGVTWGIGEAG